MRIVALLTIIAVSIAGLTAQTLNEGFESGTLPDEWSVIDNDGDDNPWEIYQTTNSHTGDYCMRVHYNSSGCDDWLITPQLTLENDEILSFWTATNSSSYLEDFNVKVSRTGNAIEDFDITIAEVLQTPFDWTEYRYGLTEHQQINAGDQIYIAIQCVSVDSWYLFIDDITVNSNSTTPVIEIDYTEWDAGRVMLGNTADPGNIFRITNIGVGNLEFISITDLSGSEFTTDFVLSTQLAEGESYSFGFDYIPTDTDQDEIDFIIESNGGPPQTICLSGIGIEAKLYESFESDMIPVEWTVVNNDGGEYEWHTASGASANLGTFGLEKHWEEASDDWIITPAISVEDGDFFSLWAAAYDEDYPENFNIKVSTSGTGINDFSVTLAEITDTPTEWTQYYYDLTENPGINEGDDIYIAIQCVSQDAYYLFLDDFYIGSNPMPNYHNELPVTAGLKNYPNPFNPNTTISYSFNEKLEPNAEMVIYNLKGNKVFSIPLKDKEGSVSWLGVNQKGKSVASGFYFYSLHNGGKILETKRMLLLK